MIYLITGTPGAGKTSHTLWDFLNDKALKDRPRYATPIKGLDFEAHNIGEIDSLSDWQSLPDASVILVDEADQYLAPSGRDVPAFIKQLSRHRHRGFDFYIITQMGSMINHHVRGLIEAHIHYIRVRGDTTVSRYRWESYQSNPDNPAIKKKGLRDRIKVNPQVFELYTSASVNTRKREIPWRQVALMAAVIPAFLMAGVFTWKIIGPKSQPDVTPAVVTPGQTIPQPGDMAGASSFFSSQMGEKQSYSLKDFSPRSDLDPSTAPIYDDLTTPTDFPRVSACMISQRTGCHCYTQQATPVNIPYNTCRSMIAEGWFDRWKTGRAQADQSLQAAPEQRGSARMDLPRANSQTLIIGQDSEAPTIADIGPAKGRVVGP